MTHILIICVVIGFAFWVPDIYGRRGAAALWIAVPGASVLAGLLFMLDAPTRIQVGGDLRPQFFWLAAIAAACGFTLLALHIRRRHRRLQTRMDGRELALAFGLWLLGTVTGGALAVAIGFLLMSASAG
jgi:hypothetical protein